jgi:hypothetical protein
LSISAQELETISKRATTTCSKNRNYFPVSGRIPGLP